MHIRRLAVTLVALWLGGGSAEASVTFTLTGGFDGSADFPGNRPYSLTITYDETTPPSYVGTDAVYGNAVTSFAFVSPVLSISSATVTPRPRYSIVLINDNPAASDVIAFLLYFSGGPEFAGEVVNGISFEAYVPLTSVALPQDFATLLPLVRDFSRDQLAFGNLDVGTGRELSIFRVTPVPASLPLLGCAMAAIGLVRSMRHRARTR